MEPSLTWFRSYLTDRHHCVTHKDNNSSWLAARSGVPQGSILGPLLFIILTTDLSPGTVSTLYHMYADDTQIYAHCQLDNISSTASQLNDSLSNIYKWSQSNALTLNASKCQTMIIGSSHTTKLISNNNLLPEISIANSNIPVVNKCKNLGVTFDSTLSWAPHINGLVSKSYFKLRNLNKHIHNLSTHVKLKLCNSLILSNFDYCDILFTNLSTNLKQKVQKVQNSCLRFAYCTKRRDHITPYLIHSKWLNMENRRLLHSMCFIFNMLKGSSPSYFNNYLYYSGSNHSYSTRCNSLLTPAYHYLIKQNSFFVKRITEFNHLPNDLKLTCSIGSFRNRLKKYLIERQCSSI